MLGRKRRFLVGSVSSLVWPAVTLLLPMGITFAAARVYAEAAPAPEACDAAVVVECADASPGGICHSCASGTCACFSAGCKNGDTFNDKGNTCRDIQKCEAYTQEPACQGKKAGDPCEGAGPSGACTPSSPACLPNDGGAAISANLLVCYPSDSTGGSSSSGANGGSSSGTYIPGPPTVPGSSGASKTAPASSDDSGCATSSGTTIPLLAAPLALGLLFALRRKKKR
jgi:MYXO-CTERM domain-containing protein